MKKFFVTLMRILTGTLLLFLTAGMIWTLAVLHLRFSMETVVIPAAAAFIGGLLFFTLVNRVLVLYVFGHELTHWFAAKFFLRETGDMKVGTKGGSVAVQKPNIWITLAPYFIPFYTIIWLLVYGIFRFGYGAPNSLVLKILFAGIGLTYAFHVVLTIHSLLQEQADLKQHGRYLSISLILFFNVLLLGAGLLTAAGEWRHGADLFTEKLGLEYRGVTAAGEWLYDQVMSAYAWIQSTFF